MSDSIKKSASDQLREVAEQQRKTILPINEYKEKSFEYGPNSPNALSDGDEQGKGETTSVGNKTDVNTRITLKTINQYTEDNPYISPE